MDDFPAGRKSGEQTERAADAVRSKAKAAIFSPTIFHEPWWLNIASGGHYIEATVSSGGRLVGRLPYIQRRYFGFNTIGMPGMSHVLGPAVFQDQAAAETARSLKQTTITGELVAQLPKHIPTFFKLHGDTNNTLAFGMNGFTTAVEFTVEIPPAAEVTLWRQMRDKTRNIIRRAEEQLTVSVRLGAAEFVSFYQQNILERKLNNSYDRDMTIALITESLARDVGTIWTATNARGEIEAAIFVVSDEFRSHYFMSTRTRSAHSGAISLLIWAAIRQAALRGLVFDMDGIHVQIAGSPNMLLLTGFGGKIVPRYCVTRLSRWLQVGRALQHLVSR